MKKRFMAALLCLCLLTGMFTSVAYAASLVPPSLGDLGDLVDGDDGVISGGGSGDDVLIGDDVLTGDKTTSSGSGREIADNIDSTDGDGYALFDTEADVAYERSIDIFAQAIDTAITNAADTPVYKVEIVWGDMAFAWGTQGEYTKVWNPVDHSYTETNDSRTTGWYLIDDSELTKLEYNDKEGTYDSILAGTAQNYVLMFNHSNAKVKANVKLAEVNAPDADESTADDNIAATLTPETGFGTTPSQAADGSYDYELNFDVVTGVIYSKTNGTAGAATVALDGKPTDGALNDQTPTTVARITVTISEVNENSGDLLIQ